MRYIINRRFIQRLIISVVIALVFYFVDMLVPKALSARGVNIATTGTATEEFWGDNTMYLADDFYTHSVTFSRQDFSMVSTNVASYGHLMSYRLYWDLDGSYFTDYDSIIFTAGYKYGYVNNMQIFIRGGDMSYGYMACSAISLPGQYNENPGAQFSSFSCPYEPSDFVSGTSYRIYIQAYSVNAITTSNNTITPVMYFARTAMFYNSSDTSIINSIKAETEAINRTNETISSTDTDGAESTANGFFDNFENNDHGLSSIITIPLSIISSISSATCSPLSVPLPFVNQNVTLPCMYSIYSQFFGSFLSIYQTITFGIIAYWVCVNIYRMVKNFKNPDNDEIEVLDL